MKKTLIVIACLAAMLAAGTGLKAQEVTITLMPGWTWISIPSSETMDFATALGSFTPAVGDRIKSQWGIATYYYSARMVPVSVTFNAQQPSQQVVVATDTPQFITGNSAMGGGNVASNDGTYIIVKGICWATHETPTSNDSYLEEGSGEGSFSATMTGLIWSTTYYVRAYAVTPSGTVYGEQQSFTTRDGIPTLTTNDVTNITAISATSGGNITDNGGLSVTARGVCWSTSPNPTVSDSNTTNGTGTGSFTSSITELQIGTTYYVRAYATTNAGTGYGEQVSFTTRNGIPTVTTTEITNIEGTYANGGGNITDDGGLAVTARGVCWSTSPSPTLANSHTTNGSGAGSFSSYMTGLTMGTTYYVRAYATNSFVTVYGNQLSFTITNDEPAYVDLGLPSGLLWATCNVGADSPEEYGDYFAWGETQPKDTYDWSNYQYCNGSDNTLTKYCNDSDYGYSGFTDNLTTLLPEDDAATANWGSEWRMPTKEEWQELYQNTTHTWTTQDGVNGRLFTASNGNSIFLPAAGYRSVDELYEADHFSYYWSSSIGTNPNGAWYFDFDSVYYGVNCNYRDAGQSVRAVRSESSNVSFIINATSNPTNGGTVSGGGTYEEGTECLLTATANEGYIFNNWSENGELVSTEATYAFTVNGNRDLVAHFAISIGGNSYVDLGLPSGTLWATCNVGATTPEQYGNLYSWVDYYWNMPPNMPTNEQCIELVSNTSGAWTTRNGVNGWLFVGLNGNILFLPAAGYLSGNAILGRGVDGMYWSQTPDPYNSNMYYYLFFSSSGCGYQGTGHYAFGLSVRQVRTQ